MLRYVNGSGDRPSQFLLGFRRGKSLNSRLPAPSSSEFWTAARLEQAAIAECRRNGGSEHDIAQLREHFAKAREDVKPDQSAPSSKLGTIWHHLAQIGDVLFAILVVYMVWGLFTPLIQRLF